MPDITTYIISNLLPQGLWSHHGHTPQNVEGIGLNQNHMSTPNLNFNNY